jgi:hypothetical protein
VLKIIALVFAIVALAACMWAASPLGSASSTQPFDLNGATVPLAGVPSWPVAAGDVIVTHSAPATIVFRDGSRVVMAETSKAKIEAQGGKSVFRLLEGSGKYSLASRPSLSIFVVDRQVTLRSTNGRLVLFCDDRGGGDKGGDDRGGDNKGGGDKGGDGHNHKPPCPSPYK